MASQIDDLIRDLEDHRQLVAELETIRDRIARESSALSTLTFKIENLKKEHKELRDRIDVERHQALKQHQNDLHQREMELGETVAALTLAKQELSSTQGDVSRQQNLLERLAKEYGVAKQRVA